MDTTQRLRSQLQHLKELEEVIDTAFYTSNSSLVSFEKLVRHCEVADIDAWYKWHLAKQGSYSHGHSGSPF
jgi:hypothetical protein